MTDQSGFTLVEIIVVLVILAVLASCAVQKFVGLDITARENALSAGIGISELNGRESLIWTKIKMQEVSWIDDEPLFSNINTNFGSSYSWNPAAIINGGTLHFLSKKAKLEGILSSNRSPGKW